MTDKINTYFAILLVTIAGAGAALIIVNVAYTNAFATTIGGSEANYASLQQSILNQ
ncbi:MAG: hypothetical protein NTY93_01965 [Candidatus Kaiserbacteria bacterium]|nr:hypothetical protein [Candidatus Kaiserbacteria bacterium]